MKQLIYIMTNPILLTDSYKLTHWLMYPKELEYMYTYFESRKGAEYPETVFVGLQVIIKRFLCIKITMEHIDEAEEICNLHLGPGLFNRNMWEHILYAHNGKLPLIIKAVPEGTVVPINNVLMTIENTDSKCAALVGHFETILTHVWYPSTVATVSRTIKHIIKPYVYETCDDMLSLPYMLHDFGYRGVETIDAAGMGGLGHLVNFCSTDTLEAVLFVRRYYGDKMVGFSVPASEHSNMTIKGVIGEYGMIEHIIDKFPTGIISCVMDSYNINDAIKFLCLIKNKILTRNGKFVIRPDSGDPVGVIMDVLQLLEQSFPVNLNKKGYKVLDSHIGIIYGDGLTTNVIEKILQVLKSNGWASCNIVFGMGGGLLQKVNRDTQRNAMKCSAVTWSDHRTTDVYKDPIGSDKKSKSGKQKLIYVNNEYKTVRLDEYSDLPDLLQIVFENGEQYNTTTFKEIREI